MVKYRTKHSPIPVWTNTETGQKEAAGVMNTAEAPPRVLLNTTNKTLINKCLIRQFTKKQGNNALFFYLTLYK